MDIEKLLSDLPEELEPALFELVKRADGLGLNSELDYSDVCAVLQAFYAEIGLEEPSPVAMDSVTPSFASEALFSWSREKPDHSITKAESRW
ncbi:MAG TPA: hypothetical protein VFJ18_09000, partial [Pararhizobium sp.]|nr:hypothetical protein [Pararhizobium sp.]